MNSTPPRNTPIAWTRRMVQRGGKVAHYLGLDPITGRHRVQTSNRYHEYTDTKDTYTTWLVDDCGRARGDLAPCPEDIIGPAPELVA